MWLHGINMLTGDAGSRPMKLADTSIIGIVGTAPDADPTLFPLNTPVMCAGDRTLAAKLDTTGNGLGTLKGGMDDIYNQVGAAVIIVRVEEDVDPAVTKSNVIGGTDANGVKSGIEALSTAKSLLGYMPKIPIAPGFSSDQDVSNALLAMSVRLRGFSYLDGPNTTDAAAIAAVANYGGDVGKHGMMFDPYISVWDTVSSANILRASSAAIAGLRVKTDIEYGPHRSISNNVISGINGIARPIDFVMGDVNCAANLLNNGSVSTIINEDGWRTWGNRTLNTSDPQWAFEVSVRIDMLIKDTIQQNMLWAVDKPVNKQWFEDVTESVNLFLRQLKEFGWILGGECWADPDLNTTSSLSAGEAYWQYDFTPPAPGEQMQFTGTKVNSYYKGILPKAS